jgi:alkanesulfonate monooxygenase SsuD/methylene tetrahydromethanopterin reductase-like flavin-dependent oxidoreductase (luciferase family)
MGRVAKLGDGWYGYDLRPEDLAQRLHSLDAAMAACGRSRSEIQVIVGPNRHPVTEQTVAEYAKAGADQLVVPVFAGNLLKLEQRLDALMARYPAA